MGNMEHVARMGYEKGMQNLS